MVDKAPTDRLKLEEVRRDVSREGSTQLESQQKNADGWHVAANLVQMEKGWF